MSRLAVHCRPSLEDIAKKVLLECSKKVKKLYFRYSYQKFERSFLDYDDPTLESLPFTLIGD